MLIFNIIIKKVKDGVFVSDTKVETMDDYKMELEASFKQIKEGDILTGTIIAISEKDVTLDLKYYTEGIITVENLSNDPDFNPKTELHIGDEITATVIAKDDGEGHILLSKKEANDILAWDKLQEYLEKETVLSVKIGGVVNKGVVAYVEGIRAFIPASKLDISYVENTEEWLNKTVEAIVITADKENKKLVLSAKEPALAKLSAENKKKVSNIVVGSVVEGVVESIKPYGAFVTLENGLSGLLHISQISEKRIKNPSSVLNEGQKVTVQIISAEDGKIGLSMKSLNKQEEQEMNNSGTANYDLPKTEEIGTGLGELLKKLKL